MSGDIVWRLKAVPLTPIHVGDGDVWEPDGYVIREGGAVATLERIAASRVVAAMARPLRETFVAALDRGDLKAAQQTIERAVSAEQVLETIAIDSGVAGELREARLDPMQQGRVTGFIRSGGRPFLPGSTLKGALRTTYLDGMVAASPEDRDRYRREVTDRHRQAPTRPLRTGDLSDALQRDAFEFAKGRTEQDPWRDVKVADMACPDGATRVDRVWNRLPPSRARPDGADNDMRIYAERLLAMADGAATALDFSATFTGPETRRARQALDGGKVPSRDLDAGWLWETLRARGFAQWDDEIARFWKHDTRTVDRLRQLVTPAIRSHAGCAILRVGRFAHFESKSVEGVRVSQHHRRPTELREAGATRMMVKLDNVRVPMGWLLLCPPDFPLTPPKALVPAGKVRAAERPAARQTIYQGEPVQLLTRKGGEVLVRFENGDTEWVDASELEQT